MWIRLLIHCNMLNEAIVFVILFSPNCDSLAILQLYLDFTKVGGTNHILCTARTNRVEAESREDNGRWKRDDDIGVYGFHRDGFFMKMDGKMRKNLQIRFLNNNEFELTQTKFNDSDLRRVVVKKVMRYVRVTRK